MEAEKVKQQSIAKAAAKYTNDYDGMQWEKDRVEISFIAGAKSQAAEIEELKATIKRRCDRIAQQDKELVDLIKRVEELEQFKQEKL